MKTIANVLKFKQKGSCQKWQVVIPTYLNNGKRWFRRFETKSEAEEFADKLTLDPYGTVNELKGIKAAAKPAQVCKSDRAQADYLFGYFRQKLGTADLAEGIRAIDNHYQAHYASSRVTVADAVKDYLAYRATLDLQKRSRENDGRMGKFAAAYGPIPLVTITTGDLWDFMCTIPLGANGKATTRRNYRNSLGPFFTWAVEHAKHLKENPILSISKDDLGQGGVQKDFYPVELFSRMLRIAQGVAPVREGGECTTEFRDTLFPWFILSGFGGVRSEEAIRDSLGSDAVRWSDLKWEADDPHVHIRPEVAKGKQDKYERPIEADYAVGALRAWFATVKPRDEFICPTQKQVDQAKAHFTELTGIKFLKNGLRNTFATYARAASGSTALAAEQLGNLPHINRKYYTNFSVTKSQGQAFFALRPLAIVEAAA